MNKPTLAQHLPTIIAEIAIMILGAIALSNGLNGAIFGLCIGALAGLGGYHVKKANDTTLAVTTRPKEQPPRSPPA